MIKGHGKDRENEAQCQKDIKSAHIFVFYRNYKNRWHDHVFHHLTSGSTSDKRIIPHWLPTQEHNQVCLLEGWIKPELRWLCLCSGRWGFRPEQPMKEHLTELLPRHVSWHFWWKKSLWERKKKKRGNIKLTLSAPLTHSNEGAQTSHVLDRRHPALHWKTPQQSGLHNSRQHTSLPELHMKKKQALILPDHRLWKTLKVFFKEF